MNRMKEGPRVHSPRVFDFVVLLLLTFSLLLAAHARGARPRTDEVPETDKLRLDAGQKAWRRGAITCGR